MNEQTPMRPDDSPELLLHSIFRTIQGEGPFAGTPAIFIRLAGCNLQCPLCDTEYTQGAQRVHPVDIVARLANMPFTDLVVVTGGEPFRQDVDLLLTTLISAGHYVQVESNGSLEPPVREWNRNTAERKGAYLIISPKKRVKPLAFDYACGIKYVLQAGAVDERDGLPTGVLGYRLPPSRPPSSSVTPVYVQPADEQDEEANAQNLEATLESAMRFGYVLQLQVHKLLGME